VAKFRRNSRGEVRVSIDAFRGCKIIDTRAYYRFDNDRWLAGKQDVGLAFERYRVLADAILALGEGLRHKAFCAPRRANGREQ